MVKVEIIEATKSPGHERYLYKCLAPISRWLYSPRREYLAKAISKGFQKRLLIVDDEVVGQVEYAPAEVSGYPIIGDDLIVMNCIWIFARARGHGFGRMLVEEMRRSEPATSGFATIALENHWSPWFKKDHMEYLGFQPVEAILLRHKTKHPDRIFRLWLMWLPGKEGVPPTWDKEVFLKGVTFCRAHPLYRAKALEGNLVEEVRWASRNAWEVRDGF